MSLNLETKGGLATAFPGVYASTVLAINSSGQVVVAANTTAGGDNYACVLQHGNAYAYLYNVSSQSYTYLDGLQIFDGQIAVTGGTQSAATCRPSTTAGRLSGASLTARRLRRGDLAKRHVTDLNTMYARLLPARASRSTMPRPSTTSGDIAGYGTDAASNTNQAF